LNASQTVDLDAVDPTRGEARRLLALAGPAVWTGLGGVAMGVVDTVMVGRLGPEPLAAVALGGVLFGSLVWSLHGLLEAVTPLVAQALGARRPREATRVRVQAHYWAAVTGLGVTLLLLRVEPLLELLGQAPGVVEAGGAYVRARALGVVPDLLWIVHRSFLWGLGHTGAVARMVLVANAVNVVGNLLLIPCYGVAGAGYASALGALVLALQSFAWVRRPGYAAYHGPWALPCRETLGRIARLGLPIAAQTLVEVGAFTALAVAVGWLGPVPLAAHQVALSLCQVWLVLSDAIGIAASSRVGEAHGAGDRAGVQLSGRTALGLGALLAALSGTLVLLVPERFLRLYTEDPHVLAAALGLVPFMAVLSLADAVQIVAGFCLRAVSDSRTPFLAHLAGYWVLGLPLGLGLAFGAGGGLEGMWAGLTLALLAIAGGTAGVFLRFRG